MKMMNLRKLKLITLSLALVLAPSIIQASSNNNNSKATSLDVMSPEYITQHATVPVLMGGTTKGTTTTAPQQKSVDSYVAAQTKEANEKVALAKEQAKLLVEHAERDREQIIKEAKISAEALAKLQTARTNECQAAANVNPKKAHAEAMERICTQVRLQFRRNTACSSDADNTTSTPSKPLQHSVAPRRATVSTSTTQQFAHAPQTGNPMVQGKSHSPLTSKASFPIIGLVLTAANAQKNNEASPASSPRKFILPATFAKLATGKGASQRNAAFTKNIQQTTDTQATEINETKE